jgi:DNA-binding MarR family transcriptional regulator
MKLEEAIQSNQFKSPAQKAALNILYTAWWLRSMTNCTLKEFDLTHEQYNVLRILKGKHPQPMCTKDIASRVIEKNSNVPRITDRLVAKKWIARCQGTADRRETISSLTPAGLEVLAKATEAMEASIGKRLQLSDADADQLNELLERMRQD